MSLRSIILKHKISIQRYLVIFTVVHITLQVLFGIGVFFIEQYFNSSIFFPKELPNWLVKAVQFLISISVIYFLYKVLHQNRFILGILVLTNSHLILLCTIWYLDLSIEPNDVLFDVASDFVSVIVVSLIYSISKRI